MLSLKVSTMFTVADWPVAPCEGEYEDIVGAAVSATVKRYVVPLSPANALLLASLITPDAIVMVYCIPVVASELVGFTVAAVEEYVTWLSPHAMLTALPVAGVSTMFPVPA